MNLQAHKQNMQKYKWIELCILYSPVILVFCSIILNITQITLRVNRQYQLEPEADGVLKSAFNNLKTKPIVHIALGPKCSPDYEFVLMGIWQGTKKGCHCDVGFFEQGCDETPNCRDIEPLSPARYHFWGRDSFCVKRASKFQETKRDCDKGLKRCPNTTYCVDQDEPCPITRLLIVDDNKRVPQGYSLLDLTHSNKIIYTNTDHVSSPIIDIKSLEGRAYCKNEGKQPQVNRVYLLLRNKEYGCGKYGYNTLGSETISNNTQAWLFENNNLYEDLVRKLPDYDDYLGNQTVHLILRRRLMLKQQDTCLNFEYKEINNLFESINNLYKHMGEYSITYLFISLIIGVPLVGLIVECHNKLQQGQPKWNYIRQIDINLIGIGIIYIHLAMSILQYIYIQTSEDAYDGSLSKLNDFIKNSCFLESEWNLAFQDVTSVSAQYKVHRLLTYNLIFLVLTIIFSLFTCFTTFYTVMLRNKLIVSYNFKDVELSLNNTDNNNNNDITQNTIIHKKGIPIPTQDIDENDQPINKQSLIKVKVKQQNETQAQNQNQENKQKDGDSSNIQNKNDKNQTQKPKHHSDSEEEEQKTKE